MLGFKLFTTCSKLIICFIESSNLNKKITINTFYMTSMCVFFSGVFIHNDITIEQNIMKLI